MALTREERFLRHVEKTDGCWLWTASKTKNGYGFFSWGGCRRIMAHRAAYKLFVGEVEDNLVVCHTCDNPSCVNPGHLFKATQKENIQDMFNKGREAGFESRSHPGESHPRAKLSNDQVVEIFKSDLKYSILACEYNVSVSAISAIKNKQNYPSITEGL